VLYLTPTRYRNLGTGVDLSDTTDAELNATLAAASAEVNTVCHAPLHYSFLGGSVTAEEHNWPYPKRAPKTTDGRIWPYMRPLIDASLLRVNVTRTQYIDFTSEQLFVQRDMGYVEPVAAPNTTALFTSVPPYLLTSPVSYLDYEYGFDIREIDEPLATISGGSLQAANQFWFSDEEIILKKDGVLVDEADYTVDYIEGIVTPDTPAQAGETWTASYHHKLPPGIAQATALVNTDILGFARIAGAGLLGLSGIKVEEIELRQSSKVNFQVQPVSQAAQLYLAPYAAMFTSMR
jgi:hypothetical protein